MPEAHATQEATSTDTAEAATSGFTPPATQDELNKIISDRIARERAKTADYGDLKAKAAKFDELESASKTEAEKLAEKATTSERRATDAETRAMRLEVILDKLPEGTTPADMKRLVALSKRLVGSTREELEADASELLSTFKPAEDATVTAATASLDLGNHGTAAATQAGAAADFAKFLKGQTGR